MANDLINNIEYNLERLLNRFVSGSNAIRVKDILDFNNFELIFGWKDYLKDNNSSKDIHELLLPKNGNATLIKKIILADPGIGKSTLTYSVYSKIFTAFKNNSSRICPIHIDLAEYTGDSNFGTKDWIDLFLKTLSSTSNVKWVKKSSGETAFEAVPYFILDSLDEYLANCTISQIQDILNKQIFKEANLIGCRTQFYEYYISSSNKTFVKNFQNYVLLPWDESYHVKYTNWYFSKFYDGQKIRIDNFVERLKNSKDLWELCRVPIRYNMILEILAKNNMNFDLVGKLISIYHNYSIMTIKHESSRSKTILSIDEKIHCLKLLGWYFYDERKIGEDFEKIRFSKENMIDLLKKDKQISEKHSDINAVVEDLIKCTVLVEDSNDEFENSYTCVKFNHKSIQEYFVARYIYECLIEHNSESKLSQIYISFISQEIDQFFKDYIDKLNRDLIQLDIACNNLLKTFELNSYDESDDKDKQLRKRIAKEQIAYNLGHLKVEKSYKYLSELLEKENDEFLRRSMIIGLAFGGYYKSLDEYVDSLKQEPKNLSNTINIALQLSYFGDQPFNILEPDVDQNFPKCGNTVKKLIHVINEKKNRGSWRIDLYTILYLANHREVSKQNCYETIKENLKHFEEAINNFANDPICKNWIDTNEALQLIKTFKTNIKNE